MRVLGLGLLGLLVFSSLLACAKTGGEDQIFQGRYLVITGGCNDCHTAGYGPMEGNVPEEAWLTGDSVGYKGPWGTTYPVNLRLHMENLTEDQWVAEVASLQTRPPMPWFNLNQYKESDLRAIHAYISSLEPKGTAAPAYLPPDQQPPLPYIDFDP